MAGQDEELSSINIVVANITTTTTTTMLTTIIMLCISICFVRLLFSVNKFYNIGHFIHFVAFAVDAAAAVATCYVFQLNRNIHIVNVTSTIQLLTVLYASE